MIQEMTALVSLSRCIHLVSLVSFQHELLDVGLDVCASPLGSQLLPDNHHCVLKLGVSPSSTADPTIYSSRQEPQKLALGCFAVKVHTKVLPQVADVSALLSGEAFKYKVSICPADALTKNSWSLTVHVQLHASNAFRTQVDGHSICMYMHH